MKAFKKNLDKMGRMDKVPKGKAEGISRFLS